MSTKRIAIIGAGASGLPSIKACLDEGLEPVCFERTEELGGLWRYTDTPIDGQGCVMKSTVINTSKEMMCYSDFPIPSNYPNFMHNSLVLEYFKQYTSKFNLVKHIRFNAEVLHVSKVDNFSQSGQWTIDSRNRHTGEETREVFDGILMCTGHHAEKYEPCFPGLDTFQGKVLHSHDYRRPLGMENKRILIIGIGNSGGDMAVELSRIASQVYLSTRRGTWILHRVGEHGYPLDLVFSRRFRAWLSNCLPKFMLEGAAQSILNKKFDHELYSLRPDYGVFAQHPMVNDDMPNRIICGSIKIKADIKRFTSTGVEFVDGTHEDNIDMVVLATGYSFGFPALDKEIIDVQENHVQLYKYMFPPDLEKPTLAVIGCFQPLGSVMPISEMQARLATRVFKNDVILPSRGDMWNDIRAKEAAMAKQYVKTRRHTIQVNYIEFMDELAQLNGNTVDIWKIARTDPTLALKIIFGPVTPYQYRLCGHGKWSGAREAILTQWERIHAPLQTRSMPTKGKDARDYLFLVAALIALYFVIRYFLF